MAIDSHHAISRIRLINAIKLRLNSIINIVSHLGASYKTCIVVNKHDKPLVFQIIHITYYIL